MPGLRPSAAELIWRTTSALWNPDQYGRFRDERSLPFVELMRLVRPRAGMRVADLGCGPGEMTRLLHDEMRASETVGIDESAAMLAKAEAHAGAGLRFEKRDIREFPAPGEQYDLVFSNAALQWVPDHATLLPRLASGVAPGGQIAIQVPDSGPQLSHVVAAEVAREEPFREALGGHVREFPILTPEKYAEMLDSLGFIEQQVRLQIFVHHLASRDDVVEWVKGSLLTDYQKRMAPELFEQFLERYRELLLPRLSDRRPFFFPYRRILLWGLRGMESAV